MHWHSKIHSQLSGNNLLFLSYRRFSWHSQEGQLDLMTVLKYVDDILSKSLAFKLKVEPKFNRCSVVQVCEEADVIESII